MYDLVKGTIFVKNKNLYLNLILVLYTGNP